MNGEDKSRTRKKTKSSRKNKRKKLKIKKIVVFWNEEKILTSIAVYDFNFQWIVSYFRTFVVRCGK